MQTIFRSDPRCYWEPYLSAHYASLCIILGCISHLAIILLFGVLTVKYHEMTKNYIFREFECGLTIEQTAELCFKSVRTITEWDKGRPIPPECKRLMRLYCNRKLGINNDWYEFSMIKDSMKLPTGRVINAQQLLTAVSLLEIDSIYEVKTKTLLLKYVRCIERIKSR